MAHLPKSTHAGLQAWSKDQERRALKRSFQDYRELPEELDETEGTRSSPSRNSSANRRKRARKSEKKVEEERAFCERYDRLEFKGRRVPMKALDKELKFAEPCETLKLYLEENPNEKLEVLVDEWAFVEANSVVELNHLDRFNREYPPFPEEHRSALEDAVAHVSELLTLEQPLVMPTKEDLSAVRFLGSKFPGVEYKWKGYDSRIEADTSAQLDAEDAWDRLMRGERVQPHLNRIGGRGKLVRKSKLEATKEKPSAGRLIFMTSQRDLKLNGALEQRLTPAYKDSKYPISVGKAWWFGGTAEFLDRFKEFRMFSCFDAEKYDSSLPPWLIQLSLNILRDQFADGWERKYDAYWEFIYEGLVTAPLYLDNGMVFERNGGSTSGHSFNTLMQSVATLIMGYTSFRIVLIHLPAPRVWQIVWIESLGDDQHTGGKEEAEEVTVEEVGPVTQEVFGVSWMGDKSFNTDRLMDLVPLEFQGSQYLGKYFRHIDTTVEGVRVQGALPYRPFEETLLRLYYPERGEQGVTHAWMRAVGHYADAAGNDVTRDWLDRYLDWLAPRVTLDEFAWNEYWRRKFTMHGLDRSVPVPAKRLTYLEWLTLVLGDEPDTTESDYYV